MSAQVAFFRRSVHRSIAILAVLGGLVPCVIFPDLVVPTHPPVTGGVERLLFELLAHPPTYARNLVHIHGGYTGFFRPDGFPDGLPPFFRLAAEHVAFASPFWFVALSGAFESLLAVLRVFASAKRGMGRQIHR
jgi:hypothetical protein